MCQCACCTRQESRPRFRPVGLILNLALAWLLLVVTGGPLINTGHPVAVEAGRLIRVVTLVDPAIMWADDRGVEPVAEGLRILSHGIPLGPLA
jgi:hypothetical protein